MKNTRNFIERLGFEIRVEMERYLCGSKLVDGAYNVRPLKTEQYIKHFVSAGLLRVSSGLCLQEVMLYGHKQDKHKVDFISASEGVIRAIEFKYAWIGTQNKKASGAHPRNALEAAWAQVADIKKSELRKEGISRRMALSIGMPWFRAPKQNHLSMMEKREANLGLARSRIKKLHGNNFIEVPLRPTLATERVYHLEIEDENGAEYIEWFPSFFLLWREEKV